MRTTVQAECPKRCGTRLTGDIDTTTREFIHRFEFPAGAWPAGAKRTEVERAQLATFAPDSRDWFVACPVCGAPIRVDVDREGAP
jgi:hypothetical protein